jgi:ubiquinone/menaquinone biosynthesis C-methylase UbiE
MVSIALWRERSRALKPTCGNRRPHYKENRRVPRSRKLPAYATNLLAHHRAFGPELEAMIAHVPLEPGSRVLDLASGDGVYSQWLSDRGAQVIAVDLSTAFLDLAQDQLDEELQDGQVQLVKADVKRLPFPPDSFDLAWCAQSLYSLPSPVQALRAMTHVIRPGGYVAVIENDEFHHVLLPWPVEVELALRQAELQAFSKKTDRPQKFYIGRQLRKVFREAGLTGFQQVSRTIDRQHSLNDADRKYFATYLDDLHKQAKPHLEPKTLQRLEQLLDPASPSYMLDDPDFTATCLNRVAWARKPGE